MIEQLWTFKERDTEELYDADYATQKEAYDAANEAFGDQIVAEESPHNNQYFSEPITLVRFHNAQAGEVSDEYGRVIEEEIQATLEYTHYHGDFAEHNLNHRGGFL